MAMITGNDTSDYFEKIVTARKAIIDKHGTAKGYSDKMQCPICKTGTLLYSRAECNGHIHARCDTKDCVSWME
jgi:hypothetical protein